MFKKKKRDHTHSDNSGENMDSGMDRQASLDCYCGDDKSIKSSEDTDWESSHSGVKDCFNCPSTRACAELFTPAVVSMHSSSTSAFPECFH